MKTNIYNQPQNKEFYLYLDVFENTETGESHNKVGKENIEESRHSDWSRTLEQKKKEGKISKAWQVRRISINGSPALPLWWYDEERDSKFYMTKSENLTGNDADDIFRDKMLDMGFTIPSKSDDPTKNNKSKRDIYLDGEFITDEGVDFVSDDINEIVNQIIECKNTWIKECKESIDPKGKDYIRIDSDKTDSNRVEFGDVDVIRKYQVAGVEWIEEKNREGKAVDHCVIIGCGGGKTSISTYATVDKAFETKKPVLLLSGLLSPKFAYEDDFNTFFYKGKVARLLTIDEATKQSIEDCFKTNILPIIFITCQSSIERNGEDETKAINISKDLKRFLKKHIGISTILTDENHKVVFGDKSSKVIDEIRSYPENADVNAFHFTGTGFSIVHNFDRDNLYDYISDKIIWEELKGKRVEKRHMLYSTNPNFIDVFYNDMKSGWKYLLEGGNFEYEVDNLDSIYTFKNKIEKPVICAYLKNRKSVKEAFSILNEMYTYDQALLCCANYGANDAFAINTPSGRIDKISTGVIKAELKREIRKAVAQGKLVILLNVNKFVESWTIPEMNVQLYLRNISSADVFWQTIARGMRPYCEGNHRIKSEVYVFLYGSTFYDIIYKWYNVRLNREKAIHKKDYEKNSHKALNELFFNTTFHIDGVSYGEGEVKDINDLRDDIVRIQKEKCYGAGIDTFINGIFKELYGSLFDNIDCGDIYSSLRCHKSTIIRGNALKKGGHDNGGKGNGQASSITGKDFYDHLKTYLLNLAMWRISKFMYDKEVSYDEIAEHSALNPLVKDGGEFMYKMWEKIDTISKVNDGKCGVSIKADIEKFIKEQVNWV